MAFEEDDHTNIKGDQTPQRGKQQEDSAPEGADMKNLLGYLN
jgi:hypothetical protein